MSVTRLPSTLNIQWVIPNNGVFTLADLSRDKGVVATTYMPISTEGSGMPTTRLGSQGKRVEIKET